MKNTLFKHIALAAFLLSTTVLVGCGSDKGQGGPIPELTYMEVATTAVNLETELSGRTTAYQTSEVRPQVGGIILKRLFEEGSEVKEGEQLYQIDPALYKASVETAKANLMRAEANANAARLLAKRYGELVKSNAVSKQEYDNAQASYKQAVADVAAAKASLDTAEINLEYTKVLAPISGIIGKSSVTQGALVAPGQAVPLATIQQLDQIYVDVTQSSTELLRLQKTAEKYSLTTTEVAGAEATLILPDGTEYKEKGRLLFSEVTIDPSTGSYMIRATFPNPDRTLLQSLYVRLRISEASSENAILVPQRTINYDLKGNPFAYVLLPKEFEKDEPRPQLKDPKQPVYQMVPRPLTLDRVIDNKVVVLSGLKAGDKLVVNGTVQIRPSGDGKAPLVTAITLEEEAAKKAEQAKQRAAAQGKK